MPLPLACPAASEIGSGSVRCGVLAASNDDAQIKGFRGRAQVNPVMDGERDASTVRLFCCRSGAGDGRAGYVHCTIWRAAREAETAGRKGPDALRDEQAAHVRDGYRPAVADGLAMLAERG